MAVRIAALYLASTLLLLLLLGGGLYLGTERALVESRRQDLQALAAGDAAFLERAVGTEDDLLTLAPVIVTTLPLNAISRSSSTSFSDGFISESSILMPFSSPLALSVTVTSPPPAAPGGTVAACRVAAS